MLRYAKNALINLATAMMVGGVFLLPFAARAATVLGYSDTLTRHQISVASDHTLLFATPTGVESSTDAITLDFDSSASPTFAFGSVSFDDVDLAVDTTGDTTDCSGPFTDKTLAASASAGVWGVAIASNVLTLTAPTDAAIGEIPAGDCVRIQIGTNAGGADQITNPSSAGVYQVNLAGTFGDTGELFISIIDADQVTVTATVASSGGGGGGGPPPPSPPIIENIQVIDILDTTAMVTWTTNVGSDSKVDYGLTSAYGSTETVAGSVFSHSVSLSSLTPGTLYHFRVRSLGAGGESSSSDNTFTTLDTTAPVISNITVTNITGTSATITWDTDEDATSRVDYDTSPEPYTFFQEDLTMTNSHSVSLSGLTPNTVYLFRVTSEDASANSDQSVEFTFQTADTVAPVISVISVIDITETSGTVTWSTDELADSKVVYGLTNTYGNEASEAPLIANHSVPLTLLVPGTQYHFAVVSSDAAGNSATSTDQTFTTLTDTTPPANVSGFTATAGDQEVVLGWTNPGDADFTGTLIKKKTGSSPTGPTDGTTVYDGTGTSFTDTGLTNGTTYFYAAFSYDASGNFASGALDNATPFDLVAPGPVTGFAAVPGDAKIQLTWTNPTDADFASIQIQRSTSGFPATVSEGTTIFVGSGTNFLDSPLTNGTTYYYSIFAYDTSGNVSSGVQASATPIAPGPVCGNGICEAGEDSVSCVVDCPIVDVCGDGICGTTEDSASCPADCPAPPTSVCGNGICEAGEDSSNCAADCPVTPTVICGDGICEGSEDYLNCAADCPAPPTSVCGNGICEAGEDSSNCAADCPVTPVPPTPSPIPLANIELWVMNRTIRLVVDDSGIFHTLPNRTLTIVLKSEGISETIDSVFLTLGDDEYIMRPVEGAGDSAPVGRGSIWSAVTSLFRAAPAFAQSGNSEYEASIALPGTPGAVPASITVNYVNGTSTSANVNINVDGYGTTLTEVDGSETSVPDASIVLETRVGGNWAIWDAVPYFQNNPTTSGSQGRYGFMVPLGTYRVVAEKAEYRDITTAPIEGTNVINARLFFIKKPVPITEVIVPGASVTENILNVTRNVTEQTTYITSIVQREVIEDPRVKKATTNFIVPAAAVATTVVVASSMQAVSFLSYLYFLLTQPILLIARRKRKEYGTIFNSLSMLPIDLAIVRLFRKSGKLVRTSVTDKQGRYAFLVEPGEYRIESSKPNFIFPTEFMKGMKEGGKYLDIYHGEIVEVNEKGAVITANIPMDPIESVKSGKRLIIDKLLRRLQDFMGAFSVIVTGIAYIFYRFPWLLAIFLVQLAMYLIFRRISRPKRPKNWGIVYDKDTKKPVSYAVARIIETEYNKVLESQVTDRRGRYNFLVGNSKYYVTVEKPGYEKEKTREIDLTEAAEGEAVIAEDVAVKKTSSEILREVAQKGMSDEEKKAYEAKFKKKDKEKPQVKPPIRTMRQPDAPKKQGTDESDENEMKRLYMERMKEKAEHSELEKHDSEDHSDSDSRTGAQDADP